MSAVTFGNASVSLPSRRLPALFGALGRVLRRHWRARLIASRLHQLSPFLLRDIGMERHEIEQASLAAARRLER